MSPPAWNVGYLDCCNIECYTSLLRERSISMSPIWGSLFLSLPESLTSKGVSVNCIATIQLQFGESVSPIPTKMPVFQHHAFHVIFLILCFSLSIDSFYMKRILLRFRDGLYPIIYICLSVSDQIFFIFVESNLCLSGFTSISYPLL